MSQWRTFAWLAVGALLMAASAQSSAIGLAGTWVALTLAVRAWRVLPRRQAWPALAVALYTAMALALRGQLPVAGPIYFALVAVVTVVGLLPFAVDRWIGNRLDGVPGTLVFPLAWVAEEFLRSRLPNGPETWGSIAYTQYGNLPLMQLASVTGIWGISFLVAWFASVAAWSWERGFAGKEVRRTVLAYATVLLLVLLAGGTRLALAPQATRTIRMATVTVPAGLFGPAEAFRIADGRVRADLVADKLARLQDWFFEHTEREADAGARLVAWPEMGFLVAARDEAKALGRAKRLAAARGIYVSMGVGTLAEAGRRFENKAVLVDPSGQVAYSYLKSRPVMGWEASVMKTGDGRLPVVDTALGRVSTAICFDNDSPEFVRQVARGRADLWILPANDWPEIRRVHFEMAAFRAIENGTPILRAASNGVSGVIDPWGRVVAATDHLSGAPTMRADLPVAGVHTVYSRLGDAFAWGCVAGCVASALLAFSRAPRASAESLAPASLGG